MGICSSRKTKIMQPYKITPLEEEGLSPLSSVFVFVQKGNIQKHYTLKQILGTGFFGHVRLAVPFEGMTKETFAVKSIAKEKINKKSLLKRELETLHSMDHPNIIKLYEIYEDERYIHLVMELCTGGELFQRVLQQGRLSEEETASLTYKLLHAVNYMHNLNISHRDIKPDNILYSNDGDDGEIKLIDFGLSNKFAEGTEMRSMVGTPYYVAPEVLQKKYGPECDIWSIGVLIFFLLTGTFPFDGQSRKEIYLKILTVNYSFEDTLWTDISQEAKDLIVQMLCKSRKNRITAAAAMDHPWVAANFQFSSSLQQARVLRRLSRTLPTNALRTDILNVISRHLSTEELKNLNRIFRSIDTNHTGFISLSEFEQALAGLESSSSEDIKETFNRISLDGKLNYSDFVTAAMDRRILYNREILWMTFKFFDVNDKGYITVPSMKSALEKLEVQATEEEVLKMIQEAGLKYDNWIDFNEFCKMLEPLPDEISSVSRANSDLNMNSL